MNYDLKYLLKFFINKVFIKVKKMHYLPANVYLFKVNNRTTRKRSKTYPKLTIKTPEQRHWRRSGVFIVNSEHNSHLFLVFLLSTSNKRVLTRKECYKLLMTIQVRVKYKNKCNLLEAQHFLSKRMHLHKFIRRIPTLALKNNLSNLFHRHES